MTTRAVSQKAICLLIGLSCSSRPLAEQARGINQRIGLGHGQGGSSPNCLSGALAPRCQALPVSTRLEQRLAWLGRYVRLLCLVRCGWLWLCSVALVSIQLSRARDRGWWPALPLLVHDESDSQRGSPVTSHSFWEAPLVIFGS